MSLTEKNTEKTSEKKVRVFLFQAIGLLVFVLIVVVVTFFSCLRGAEQTMVPEVRGKDLTEALLELQAKELYPRIQLRYSQSSRDRGLILEQDPRPGTIVKAGRRIRLVVSLGVMINRVENFVGRNIDEVRLDLQTFVTATGSPLLVLREPLMYDFSSAAPGTIIRQNPEPGTDISGPTTLEFVVSRGHENVMITTPQFTGLSITAALEHIGRTDVFFEISVRDIRDGERGETVVFQNPAAGVSVPSNTVMNIVVNTPSQIFDHEVFRLFVYDMPRNPYPLPVRLEALLPTGGRINLISVDFPGGRLTVPYRLPLASVLILYLMNREIYRETVMDF